MFSRSGNAMGINFLYTSALDLATSSHLAGSLLGRGEALATGPFSLQSVCPHQTGRCRLPPLGGFMMVHFGVDGEASGELCCAAHGTVTDSQRQSCVSPSAVSGNGCKRTPRRPRAGLGCLDPGVHKHTLILLRHRLFL